MTDTTSSNEGSTATNAGSPIGITREKASEPDLTNRPITGDRYYSQEFADLEWNNLWPRVWQIAGRVDQISEPGDYVTYEIGRDSILCARGDDGRVRAFF